MKKTLFLLAVFVLLFTGCGSAEMASEGAGFGGEWSRVATYTDGADMNTGPAWMNFLGDGTFVSTTELCTATGNYEILPEDVEKELGDMVLDAGTMSMSYVKSDCPGYTLSALTYAYSVGIGEDGGETLTMGAEYQGHIVTEVYVR